LKAVSGIAGDDDVIYVQNAYSKGVGKTID